MAAALIEPAVDRLDLLAHHDTCRTCASLFAFARSRADLSALDAWRHQLAAHLRNNRERADFDGRVIKWIVAACQSHQRPA